ncbi:MAG: class I SAM-dependent methyltransferase [Actinobacteria bacterium]|nr:class I SAM-dependent methyltransferase [Actinomycetota bacterium]
MPDDLLHWLERSRAVGFLGPGPVDDHIAHAVGFAEAVGEPPGGVVDLGSGGGVPGLVLAQQWTDTRFVLLDSNERRTDFLRSAVVGLGWAGRVEVVRARAEVAGRDDTLRGWFDVVVSRSFGPPPVTAECAAPLLRPDGLLVVSEPPDGEQRWPEAGMALVGLRWERRHQSSAGAGYAVLRQSGPCPVRYPRREGVPGKRPLW